MYACAPALDVHGWVTRLLQHPLTVLPAGAPFPCNTHHVHIGYCAGQKTAAINVRINTHQASAEVTTEKAYSKIQVMNKFRYPFKLWNQSTVFKIRSIRFEHRQGLTLTAVDTATAQSISHVDVRSCPWDDTITKLAYVKFVRSMIIRFLQVIKILIKFDLDNKYVYN